MLRDPETPNEWRIAVAMATVLLHLDAARQYGLVTGGPVVSLDRCEDIVNRGRALGYVPTEEELATAIQAVVRIGRD